MFFSDLFIDVTKFATKLPTSEYNTIGKHPIIDQGQKQIAGYTDLEQGLFTDVPAIIFGDHTRVIKYIDTPFFIGADGVKVIKCLDKQANYNYLYYLLSSVRIPNTGYNRHYKWLKEAHLVEHTKEEQEKILSVLSTIDNILNLCFTQINKLDELIKSRFVEMFGDPVINTLGWKQTTVGNLCFVTKLAGFEYTDYIHYQDSGDVIMIRGLNVKDKKLKLDDIYYIDSSVSDMLPRSQLKENDIVMTYVGVNIGDVALVDGNNRYHLAPNVAKISPNNFDLLNPVFFVNLLAFNKDNYASNATNTAKQALNMNKIRKLSVMLPPLVLQTQFADLVTKVDQQKSTVQKSIDKLETLKKSLMQEYFG